VAAATALAKQTGSKAVAVDVDKHELVRLAAVPREVFLELAKRAAPAAIGRPSSRKLRGNPAMRLSRS
jgi:hypothetical protein